MNRTVNMIWMAGVAITLGLTACNSAEKSAISGEIKGAEGKSIYLERFVNNRPVKTDSTVIGPDGSFSISPSQPLELNFYRLVLSDRDFIVLIADSTESVQVKGEAGKLNLEAKVSGSDNTEMLREFEASCNAIAKEQEEAIKKLQNPSISAEEQAAQRQVLVDVRKKLSEHVRKWLESHSSTPAAIAAVQMLDVRTDIEVYKKVLNDLSGAFADNNHYKLLKQKVDMAAGQGDPRLAPQQLAEAGPVATGNPAPEIALPNPKGKVMKLSDLKGKVVLVDFWASWCGPCRRENPNVVKAYNAYHKDGFEVMSVSLDKDKAKWEEAIKQDGLIWDYHVSDLKFWESKAAADYGVHSIPFPVLVGKDGNVIAYGPNIRGENLENHLKQIYGH